jgi:hypothetical protein
MSVTAVQSSVTNLTISATSGNITPGSTPTLGNRLVVFVAQSTTSDTCVISDNQGTPNTWVQEGTAVTTGGGNGLAIWSCQITHTGAGFAITYSGFTTSFGNGEIFWEEDTGQNGIASGFSIVAQNTAGTAVSEAAGTVSVTGARIFLAISPNSSETITWGAPSLALLSGDNTNTQSMWIGVATVVGTGAQTATATMSVSAKYSVAAFMVAASAPPPTATVAWIK